MASESWQAAGQSTVAMGYNSDTKISGGIQCHLCPHGKLLRSWQGLVEHLRRPKPHNIPMTEIQGTYLHQQYLEERSSKQSLEYSRGKKRKDVWGY